MVALAAIGTVATVPAAVAMPRVVFCVAAVKLACTCCFCLSTAAEAQVATCSEAKTPARERQAYRDNSQKPVQQIHLCGKELLV